MSKQKSSHINGFYKQTPEERLNTIKEWSNLNNNTLTTISGEQGLQLTDANNMIENAIGTFALPLGIATNFLINRKNYLIPMAIEEPSVIAGVSNAAKLFRAGGGLTASSDPPIMIGQIQVLNVKNTENAAKQIQEREKELLQIANETAGSITKRGGGATSIHTRKITTSIGDMLIIHLLMDTRDAMGANAVNTAVEHLAPHIERITGGRANLRILSNLSDQRKARAEGNIPAHQLTKGELDGDTVITSILEATAFAEADPYRAATHNKGIMNGIDAVVIATGNDWRAVEAGAHAYAARDGSYTSLTHWRRDEHGNLHGTIELPLAIGIIGGATRVHPTARAALQILGVQSARELAEIIAAVGLAQNLAAMRALATEGIQRGHMRMHARQLATAAGATNEQVTQIAQAMIAENNIRLERAKEIVKQLQQGNQT